MHQYQSCWNLFLPPTLYRISLADMAANADMNVEIKTQDETEVNSENDVEDFDRRTESNDAPDLRQLKNYQTGALTRLTKKRNCISDLMADENNLHLVKTEITVFNDYVSLYQEAHMKLCEAIQLDADLDVEAMRYDNRQKSIIEFRSQAQKWIKMAENHISDQCSSVSSKNTKRSAHSSSSYRTRSSGTRSSKSSVSSRAREKARLAELMIEREMLHRKQELKLQTDELRLDVEIAKAKAREKVYASDEDVNTTGPKPNPLEKATGALQKEVLSKHHTNTTVTKPTTGQHEPSTKFKLSTRSEPVTHLNADAQAFVPQKYTSSSYTEGNLISTNSLLAALSLPQPEVPKFSGDLLDFANFINAFDSRIAIRVNSDADRLYYLNQHLLGEPKEIICGCLHMDPQFGYIEARQLLDKEYGDPYKLSMSYLNKITDWPIIKGEDNVSLKKFAMFLNCCYSAMQSLSYMHVLNNPCNMLCIWKKLPYYLQNKWRESVNAARRNSQRDLTFPELVKFVTEASDVANDPVYNRTPSSSHNANRHNVADGKRSGQRQGSYGKQKVNNFAIEVASDSQKCSMCQQQSHTLGKCKVFLDKSIEDKRAFLKEKQLCFGCYGTNHFTKGCMNKHKCESCGKRHPTALHVDNFVMPKRRSPSSAGKQTSSYMTDLPDSAVKSTSTSGSKEPQVESNICAATDTAENTSLHAILPVRVSQKGSDKQLITYCFYDNGSSACFISNDIYEQLGAEGTETRLQLKTMHGQSCISSTAVRDLVVTDINGEHAVELPRTYTRDEIPVNTNHIPDPNSLTRWSHLKHVVDSLTQVIPGLEVGILIGTNCPLALEPLEVVPTDGRGPYAARLLHGWTLYGPTKPPLANEEMTVCNRIVVQESTKELMTPQSILNMFEMDFNEHRPAKTPGERGMSQEDCRFLNIVENGIDFRDGQYTVPLPFRYEHMRLPNNKSQAVKRAQWQQKKMASNPQYHSDYKTFMQKLLDNKYAEAVPLTETMNPPRNIWYLPHHGVYNPNKVGKIRVVFDCSARFAGTCLNDHLLQGPDLTNSLVGVLIRFRNDHIA